MNIFDGMFVWLSAASAYFLRIAFHSYLFILSLSGETANGDYPVEAVQMMANTCLEAESMIDYDAQYDRIRHAMIKNLGFISPSESIASSAVKTARDVNAQLIIVLTTTGEF